MAGGMLKLVSKGKLNPYNQTKKVVKSAPKFNYVKSKGNLAQDVKYLKKMVKRSRPEVKFYQVTPSSNLVGQVDGNDSGASAFAISNTIGGGVGSYSARVGEEMNLIGIQLRLQFQQQSANNLATKYKVEVFRLSDDSVTLAEIINRVYEADTISQVVDINSTRNQLYMSDYKKIGSRTVYLPADNMSGTNMIKDLKMFIKRQDRLRFNGTGTANSVNYQYVCIVRANSGNRSTTTASTNALVSQTAVSTGAKYTYYYKNYLTDP